MSKDIDSVKYRDIIKSLETAKADPKAEERRTVLYKWSIGYAAGQDYVAPEIAKIGLIGKVYNHPRKPDGWEVRTSAVVAANGRIITTHSGTVYELRGDPDPGYVAWLAANNLPPLDLDNPVKIRSAS